MGWLFMVIIDTEGKVHFESIWRRRNAGRIGKNPTAEWLGQRAEAFGEVNVHEPPKDKAENGRFCDRGRGRHVHKMLGFIHMPAKTICDNAVVCEWKWVHEIRTHFRVCSFFTHFFIKCTAKKPSATIPALKKQTNKPFSSTFPLSIYIVNIPVKNPTTKIVAIFFKIENSF